jgi:hypothetical protein
MLFTRLLPLLFLLSLSSVALCQNSKTQAVPETCAVTKPLEHPFVPPKPYSASRGVDWFGTDKLWTYLPSGGIWGQGEKTLWFREEWSHYHRWIPDEVASKLTITARRLDAPIPPPEISAGPTFNRDWKAFMLGGISFPTPGCWEITGRYEDVEVQFVVWVVPDAPGRQTQDQAVPLSIVVDKSCLIQPESDALVLGDHVDAFRDDPICHLESVLSSHHTEEKITDSQRSRYSVRVAEQEYVVQNPTDKPAVFIVRHEVPENWTVDSDPQPSSMDGATAVFRVNAEPGQRVRLHVGMHRSDSIDRN